MLIYEMLCGWTPFWDSKSVKGIYENIVNCRIKYPRGMNPDAQDLLTRLITPDLSHRLGNIYGGAGDLKAHPWFSEVNWETLEKRRIEAPYRPPIGKSGDGSQFDVYPEEVEEYGATGENE